MAGNRTWRGAFLGLLLAILLCGHLAVAQSSPVTNHTPTERIAALVNYVQSRHKAPFHRDGAMLPQGGAQALLKRLRNLPLPVPRAGTNVRVNQDRNPWPKTEVGAAVDPFSGKNYVVMSNDFRQNYDHMFYHVSTNGGKAWTDDSMVGGADPVTGPLTFLSDPGVAFDSVGHSFVSTLTGNVIFDTTNDYSNLDSEVEVALGFANGRYTNNFPAPIDDQPCSGTITAPNCPAALDKPLITVDNVPDPNKGTIYVHYALFCNGTGPNSNGPCTDGTATIPALASVILESHSPGWGLPFSPPSLVSGALTQAQFSDIVIDSHGTPHAFFDDYTNFPTINMYESTLISGAWMVTSTPVVSFLYNGLNNFNWQFRDTGAAAPGCGIAEDTAYCAFSANQIASGPIESTPSVNLAVVDTLTGASTIHRVNDDQFNNGKDHFFAWATVTANGVYVGWYDNRKDPFNAKVQYFVGKSTDRGNTFPTQKAVSDTSFNPCVGFPFCGFFGDYTQLISGPDNVVHAAWSDTRDGASMQLYSQAVTW
jgi:hypothetical protein